MSATASRRALLPGVEAEQLAESTATPQEASRSHGILIVDDEVCVLGVLVAWMRQEGFTVWSAANGREAIDLYRQHHQTIDVVLMDVRMPRPDGPQTLAVLQELNPRIRCCFMSGDLGPYTEQKLCGLGASAVIRKPVALPAVCQLIREWASSTAPSVIEA